MVGTLILLALSTLASEDLACVAAGVLIANGDVSPVGGVMACALGIFTGDCGLWALGRFGSRVANAWPWVARRLAAASQSRTRWAERNAGWLLVGSRFTPGTRLPLYVGAGMLGLPFGRFAAWTGLGALLWTPAIVLASAHAGDVGTRAGEGTAGGVLAFVGAFATVLVVPRAAGAFATSLRSSRFGLAIDRYRRWEFWPPWLFYAPVVGWVLLLALRYRGLTTITACNPAIPDGGVVGESKADILERLPEDCRIPHLRLAAGGRDEAVAMATCRMASAGWTFPVIVKPDVGQRGTGVRLVRSTSELAGYLRRAPGPILLQPFHEGPFEAGIFYYRLPGESRGRILSITDKRFPVVIGDGRSTLRQLIESHPRYRLQASLFTARHAATADTVLPRGERKQLTLAGNHAQGTTFRDGAHLWTLALEHRIDAIARHRPGFFIGRFDVRYRDPGAFKAGRDLAVVELNGATAEPTDIYDPDNSLLRAYRGLFRQWALVFAIGASNRARGTAPSSMRSLVRLIVRHLTTAPPDPIAD
jgi:membrane protein DedA with SNARE-associated domain